MFKAATAKHSPIAKLSVVDLVGTIPSPASLTSGIKSFTSDALYNVEFFFETIPIKVILFRFANWITGFSSWVSPELLKSINQLFLEMLPKSPCEHSFADKEKDEQPTDDKVADILIAIK